MWKELYLVTYCSLLWEWVSNFFTVDQQEFFSNILLDLICFLPFKDHIKFFNLIINWSLGGRIVSFQTYFFIPNSPNHLFKTWKEALGLTPFLNLNRKLPKQSKMNSFLFKPYISPKVFKSDSTQNLANFVLFVEH